MEGPALARLHEIASITSSRVIASGGVGTLDHLTSLSSSIPALDGAIVGRALYEQRFTVTEGIAALRS